MDDFPQLLGSPELQMALAELLEAGRRSVAAYRAAEEVVVDHRVQAALVRLRLDHERHARELASLLVEMGGELRESDGAEAVGPVGEALERGEVTGAGLLEAVERAEAGLREAYERHVARGYVEPIRAVLSRHRREEEAHGEWLQDSAWCRALRAG